MRVCMWVCLYLCSHRADCINPLLILSYYDGWMPHSKMKWSTAPTSLSINAFCAFKCPHCVPYWMRTVYSIDTKAEAAHVTNNPNPASVVRLSAQRLLKDTSLSVFHTMQFASVDLSGREESLRPGRVHRPLCVKCIIESFWKALLSGFGPWSCTSSQDVLTFKVDHCNQSQLRWCMRTHTHTVCNVSPFSCGFLRSCILQSLAQRIPSLTSPHRDQYSYSQRHLSILARPLTLILRAYNFRATVIKSQ